MRHGSKVQETSPSSAVTLRSVWLGILLIIPNVYFLIYNHVYLSALPTTISLFFNVVMCLFVLVLINLGLRRLTMRWALTRQELLTVYAMLAVGSAMSGHDMLQTVVPALTHGYWYATPENEWQSLFWRHLPRWLVVQDPGEDVPWRSEFRDLGRSGAAQVVRRPVHDPDDGPGQLWAVQQ